jgi:hypothetical protein
MNMHVALQVAALECWLTRSSTETSSESASWQRTESFMPADFHSLGSHMNMKAAAMPAAVTRVNMPSEAAMTP